MLVQNRGKKVGVGEKLVQRLAAKNEAKQAAANDRAGKTKSGLRKETNMKQIQLLQNWRSVEIFAKKSADCSR